MLEVTVHAVRLGVHEHELVRVVAGLSLVGAAEAARTLVSERGVRESLVLDQLVGTERGARQRMSAEQRV